MNVRFFTLLVLALLPLTAHAQEKDSYSLENYTPPPLFGAPPANKPRPDKPVIVKPAVSPVVDYGLAAPAPDLRPSIKARTSAPRDTSVSDLTVPPKKPPLPARLAAPTPPPAPVAAEGVVKGPVSMPAVQAVKVESEVVYDAPKTPAAQPTMMERHLAEKQPEADPAPAVDIPVENKTVTLPFNIGEAVLSDTHKQLVTAQVIAPMKTSTGYRIQIQSFASPADNTQSSDRRVALSRALAIRSELLSAGIVPERIDIRALGAQNAGAGAKDRVDLVLTN